MIKNPEEANRLISEKKETSLQNPPPSSIPEKLKEGEIKLYKGN